MPDDTFDELLWQTSDRTLFRPSTSDELALSEEIARRAAAIRAKRPPASKSSQSKPRWSVPMVSLAELGEVEE